MAFEFINSGYFSGKLQLPNVAGSLPEGSALDEAIESYTKEYLYTILGYPLAARLIAIMDAYNPASPNDTATEYRQLTFGSTYVGSDGVTYKWNGFTTHVDDVGDFISPIANYVYCKKRELDLQITVASGGVVPNYEHGTTSLDTYKIQKAWNDMVKMNWHLHNWLTANASSFTAYKYIGATYVPDTDLIDLCADNQLLFIFRNRITI